MGAAGPPFIHFNFYRKFARNLVITPFRCNPLVLEETIMTRQRIGIINSMSFAICLLSIVAGVAIGALGIWGLIPASTGLLWRALGTCGVLFVGAVFSSLAIRCFKTNE